MFFELRQYRTKPGSTRQLGEIYGRRDYPIQISQGMVVLGSFIGQEEDDLFVWIRRFESEAERQQLYQAVYESDHWKNEISPRVPEMIDRGAKCNHPAASHSQVGHPITQNRPR